MIATSVTVERISIEKTVLNLVDALFNALVRAACNHTFGVVDDCDTLEVDSQANKWKSVEFVRELDGVNGGVEALVERAVTHSNKHLSMIASRTCKRFTPSVRDCGWRYDKLICAALASHARLRARRDFGAALAAMEKENSADVPSLP